MGMTRPSKLRLGELGMKQHGYYSIFKEKK